MVSSENPPKTDTVTLFPQIFCALSCKWKSLFQNPSTRIGMPANLCFKAMFLEKSAAEQQKLFQI